LRLSLEVMALTAKCVGLGLADNLSWYNHLMEAKALKREEANDAFERFRGAVAVIATVPKVALSGAQGETRKRPKRQTPKAD